LTEMCTETEFELDALAQIEIYRITELLKNNNITEFEKWWIYKIQGWFEVAKGNPPRIRKLLNLPPCDCTESTN
jgi:hypothetical protein